MKIDYEEEALKSQVKERMEDPSLEIVNSWRVCFRRFFTHLEPFLPKHGLALVLPANLLGQVKRSNYLW